MNTLKRSTWLTIVALAAGVALAQPPEGGPGRGPRGEGGFRRGGEMGGPAMKLMLADKVSSLTDEQKPKLEALKEKAKAKAEAARTENQAEMEKIRNGSSTPEERKTAMEALKAKRDEASKEVDAELKTILTSEQISELDGKAKEAGDKMRERFGDFRRGEGKPGASDDATSKSGHWRGREGGKRGEGGKRSEGHAPGKEGKKHNGKKHDGKKKDKGPKADDGATSSTAPNPFAN